MNNTRREDCRKRRTAGTPLSRKEGTIYLSFELNYYKYLYKGYMGVHPVRLTVTAQLHLHHITREERGQAHREVTCANGTRRTHSASAADAATAASLHNIEKIE